MKTILGQLQGFKSAGKKFGNPTVVHLPLKFKWERIRDFLKYFFY